MFDFNFSFFQTEWILFFISGLVLGRLGSVLTQAFLKLETSKKPQKDFSFFLQCCDKQRGFIPLFWPSKKEGKKVLLRSFGMELLMATLFIMLFYFIGWEYILLEYLIFVFALLVASAIDIEQQILPDSFTLSGIVIGLVGACLNPHASREFLPAFIGVFVGGGFFLCVSMFYYSLRKTEGLGGGDIKLLAWIGAVLTWKAVPFVIIASSFMGLVMSILMGIFGLFRFKNYLKTYIPFGPYLACAAIVYIFYGKELTTWYLNIFYL